MQQKDDLMMSSSLIEREPQLEEKIDVLSEKVIFVTIPFLTNQFLTGILQGISVDCSTVKIDLKTELATAVVHYEQFVKSSSLSCDFYQLDFGSKTLKNQKNFNIVSFKIIDFDFEKSMCVVAIDFSF